MLFFLLSCCFHVLAAFRIQSMYVHMHAQLLSEFRKVQSYVPVLLEQGSVVLSCTFLWIAI